MLVFVVLLVVLFVGLLVFLSASAPKVVEAGRLAYMWGLIVFLWCVCGGGAAVLNRFMRQ